MRKRLHIIVSCTDKKRLVTPRALKLQNVKAVGTSRATQWKERLRAESMDVLSASRMYLGSHWTTSLALPEIARSHRYDAQLWVASAGYGLIPVEANIKPYSATFSARHADSIVNKGSKSEIDEGCIAWWRQLSRWKGPEKGYPRTLEELIGNDHNAVMMVVASASYLGAMHVDIQSAKAQLNDKRRLILVSAGIGQLNGLTPNLLPVNAKLQHAVGGSRISLNAKIARKVLEESKRWPLDADVLSRRYKSLCTRLPEIQRYERQPMTDVEVEKYARSVLRENRQESATGALRKLRDSGNACEQKRFGQIFRKVKKTSYA